MFALRPTLAKRVVAEVVVELPRAKRISPNKLALCSEQVAVTPDIIAVCIGFAIRAPTFRSLLSTYSQESRYRVKKGEH